MSTAQLDYTVDMDELAYLHPIHYAASHGVPISQLDFDYLTTHGDIDSVIVSPNSHHHHSHPSYLYGHYNQSSETPNHDSNENENEINYPDPGISPTQPLANIQQQPFQHIQASQSPTSVSSITSPATTLTSPLSATSYPISRKRSVDMIDSELNNSTGSQFFLGQPPRRSDARHMSDVTSNYFDPMQEQYYPGWARSESNQNEWSRQQRQRRDYDEPYYRDQEYRSDYNRGDYHRQPSDHVNWNPSYNPDPSSPSSPKFNGGFRHRFHSDLGYSYNNSDFTARVPHMRNVLPREFRRVSQSRLQEPEPSAGFINYTMRDGPKIMTGVAPSGAAKTKQKREREAELRRREAAEQQSTEAGYY